jgi:hypothetical protein
MGVSNCGRNQHRGAQTRKHSTGYLHVLNFNCKLKAVTITHLDKVLRVVKMLVRQGMLAPIIG